MLFTPADDWQPADGPWLARTAGEESAQSSSQGSGTKATTQPGLEQKKPKGEVLQKSSSVAN